MSEPVAKFSIGQMINHLVFGYRGVIIDVDPHFLGSEDWYKKFTSSKPPKDRPWYHVLVDDADLRTYVAERNLEQDETGVPIKHGDLTDYFDKLDGNSYILRKPVN